MQVHQLRHLSRFPPGFNIRGNSRHRDCTSRYRKRVRIMISNYVLAWYGYGYGRARELMCMMHAWVIGSCINQSYSYCYSGLDNKTAGTTGFYFTFSLGATSLTPQTAQFQPYLGVGAEGHSLRPCSPCTSISRLAACGLHLIPISIGLARNNRIVAINWLRAISISISTTDHTMPSAFCLMHDGSPSA